jgi:hypothetical protein
MTGAERRAAARDQKIEALFRKRHARGDHHDHTNCLIHREAIGRWQRVECTRCSAVINFVEEDLQ